MTRPAFETNCPGLGWTIVAYPWFARLRPNARMHCSGCGAVVPCPSHGVIVRERRAP